jgi:type II secretory pathway component GspD/PulD (secretin)
MRTRPYLPTAVLALLAASPTLPVFAQPAAAPAVEAAPAADAAAAVTAVPAADTPAAVAPADAAATPTVKTDDAARAAAAVTKSKDATGKDTLSVDFPDEDIRNILRNVADLFELNIVMPETLQGKTTIKLRDVTWRQIFQNVLAPVSYTYVEDGNIIKIVSNESVTQEPTSTEVFLINYARAADILPTITSLIDASAGGKIVVDARSNSLVITERPTRLSRIRPIIETLDRATDQVMIETKFVEVTNRDVKNIGVNWSSLANYQISAGKLSGTFDRTRGQDATGTARYDNSNLQATDGTNKTTNGTTVTNGTTIAGIQSSGSTTAGSVTSNNGTPTSTSTTGSTGALSNTTNTTAANGTAGATEIANVVTNTVKNAVNNLGSLINTDGTNRAMTALFSADEFRLVLSALQTQNDVKIVSNPTIVTLNNTEASINVGEENPIPNFTYNQERGNFEVSGFTYKPIGILLKVTPQVNSRGFIKLTIAPEVSQKNGSTSFGGAGGATIPIIATRKASTQVSLKDGYTMGIGGLLTSQSTKGATKVPVLGSVPVLGRLFRSDSKNTEATNLIIFITAKTISAEGAPVEQIFDSGRVRQLDLRREDLPGYRDGSSPFVTDAAGAKPSAKTAAK